MIDSRTLVRLTRDRQKLCKSFHNKGDAARPISYSISFVFRYPAPHASESGIPFRGFYEQQSGAQ